MNIFSPILWIIALRSLAQHRLRSVLLGGAVALVTTLFVAVTGLFVGMQETLVTSATTLMSGHVNVSGFYKANPSQGAPLVTKAQEVLAVVRKAVPELDFVVLRGRGFARVVCDGGSQQLPLGGVDVKGERGLRSVLQILQGSLDGLEHRDGLMLFEKQAEKLGVKVGDKCTLAAPTPRGTNNTIDVTVVAIAADIGMLSTFSAFVNDKGLRQLYQLKDDTTGAIQLYLHDIRQAPLVQERLRKVLGQAGYEVREADPRPYFAKFDAVNREAWTGQQLDVTTWEEETSFVKWIVTLITFLGTSVILVLVVIIAVGIMNVMWITIRERTREIGTLRAVGMQRTTVLSMFVLEGFLLGLLGTVVGVVVGVTLDLGLTRSHIILPKAAQVLLLSDHLVLTPSSGWIAFSVLFITGVITLVSLFPSFLAARLKPITAMSHVG